MLSKHSIRIENILYAKSTNKYSLMDYISNPELKQFAHYAHRTENYKWSVISKTKTKKKEHVKLWRIADVIFKILGIILQESFLLNS
jgi:hypothetical protein